MPYSAIHANAMPCHVMSSLYDYLPPIPITSLTLLAKSLPRLDRPSRAVIILYLLVIIPFDPKHPYHINSAV
jgi:hypothetical protein